MPNPWQLVVLYDAGSNIYTVCEHNLTAEEAEKEVAHLRGEHLPAMSVEQKVRHRSPDAEVCRTCRRDVERAVRPRTSTSIPKEEPVTTRRTADQAPARSSTATTAVTTSSTQRKPWKKKTPVEVIMDQITRLREDVTRREEELKQAKRQMQKLDEVLKVLEST